MGVEWFLIPTLAGYWFLTHLNLTRYRIPRDSGYHVFFQAAFTGGVLLMIARVVVVSLETHFSEFFDSWKYFAPFPYSGTALVSVFLGIVAPRILNLCYSKEDAAEKVALQSGDLLEFLIAKSIKEQKQISISLKCGKCYIGFARESGIWSHGDSDVSIIPMASGYRDKDTQELHITVEYAPMIREALRRDSSLPELSLEDFQVVIPVTEIVSVRIFDFDVFQTSTQLE